MLKINWNKIYNKLNVYYINVFNHLIFYFNKKNLDYIINSITKMDLIYEYSAKWDKIVKQYGGKL